MATAPKLTFHHGLAALRAAGEETRLRILALLAHGELTVKDLTAILGQSQPRISRHLKLLVEARLIERYPEGAWVFYRLADDVGAARLCAEILATVDFDDPMPVRDRERLAAIRAEQAATAANYFSANAADWDTIRALHVDEQVVEKAIRDALGERRFETMLDLGTGTGRMLDLLAPLYDRAVGIDASTDMLAVARVNLERAGADRAQVRLGDIRNLPFPRNSFDLVTIHQVLHYLDDPEAAIQEAARVLRPGGRLVVVDFAPHDLEFLRADHAHRRLGIAHAAMKQWFAAADLAQVEARDLARRGRSGLTVTLWLARDRRILMADDSAAGSQEVA